MDEETNGTVGGSSPGAAIELREVREGDVELFFEHQLDREAIRMAAFTAKDPTDRIAFRTRWARILGDPGTLKRTILDDGEVAGHVVRFERFGQPEVTYWLGRKHWGRGVATRALAAFLAEATERPLFARAAADNLASIRVLEKCGFMTVGRERGFAEARGEEIDEVVMELRS